MKQVDRREAPDTDSERDSTDVISTAAMVDRGLRQVSNLAIKIIITAYVEAYRLRTLSKGDPGAAARTEIK